MDDDAARDSLVRTLRFEGYQVESAGDGRAAIEAVRASAPDAVLLDVSMPDVVMISPTETYAESAPQWVGAAVLIGYGLVAGALGLATLRRRDIV